MADNDRQTGKYPLEERAYRGEDGEIHHHTNTCMEQHGASGGASRGEDGQGGGGGMGRTAMIAAGVVGVAAVAAAAVVAARRSADRMEVEVEPDVGGTGLRDTGGSGIGDARGSQSDGFGGGGPIA